MSSQLFDAQLFVPDNNASHQKLVELITAGKFTGPGLPDVAHRYLDAFCNKSYSNGRRRWAGIALAGMMGASASSIQRLKKLSQGLSRIGAIVIDRDESEERRIVAGLILRQGLEAGIDFADFWESDKVVHSAPNFPRDPSEEWMGQFQTYLDDLSNLALTDLNTDATVLFPLSLSANDGFQWTGKSAVALIEGDMLTIAVSDSTLSKFHFIDIPVSHIEETRLQQESPHESQEGRSGHSMHNLVMALRSKSPSYRLDSSDHKASKFKVSFLHREDAGEFEVELRNARKSLATAATTAAEMIDSTTFSSVSKNLRKPSAHRIDATILPEHQENAHPSSDTGSANTFDEPASTEQLRGERTSTQQATQERGKGKLPRISEATKQKVVRTQKLPSGPPKVTKARASKKTTPIIDASGDETESEESSQDEYDLKSTAPTRSSASTGTGKKSQGRRKADAEDDDFVPEGPKAKPKTTKRKRGSSDTAEHNRPTKKTQTKSSDATGPSTCSATAKKQKAKAQDSTQANTAQTREPMKQSNAQQNIQNGVSARHSLIGGLIKSKSPSKAAAPTFKKPGQPASTPGRPRTQPVRTTPKPQTPIDTRRDLDGFPVHVSSSTPRSQTIHDEDFGVGHTPVDTEILSSNTKRVPDSPHAESTAISGHADKDDVHREKCIGDLETAKSDPFQQRRQGQKMTTFTRKLTGESLTDGGTVHKELFSMPTEVPSDDFEVNELAVNSASQPLPKQSPSLFKHRTQTHHQARTQDSPAQIRDFNGLSANAKELRKATTATFHEAARSLRFEATRSTHASQSNSTRAQRETTPVERSSPAPVAATVKDRCATGNAMDKRAQPNESVVSAPQEAIEDTLPEASDNPADAVDLNGETTLVGEVMDLPEQYGVKASDLRFRSSPPIPDSSSVRGAFSDESEPESEPSPPTSRADELEWEAALQPHQRALHEQLLRTSKRVMRHIVDNETAVTDIANVFTDDGERLLDLLLERQSDESAEAFQELASKKQDLLKELSDASRNLKSQRKQVKAVD